jgi:hypothetical protein
MKLDVESLTTGLTYHGRGEGKRQRYFVLSGNFNLVGKAGVPSANVPRT